MFLSSSFLCKSRSHISLFISGFSCWFINDKMENKTTNINKEIKETSSRIVISVLPIVQKFHMFSKFNKIFEGPQHSLLPNFSLVVAFNQSSVFFWYPKLHKDVLVGGRFKLGTSGSWNPNRHINVIWIKCHFSQSLRSFIKNCLLLFYILPDCEYWIIEAVNWYIVRKLEWVGTSN